MGAKNLHLEHLEDEIINQGIDGGRGAINFLQGLRDMLKGNAQSGVKMTVKWDGAPAIFAGVDPSDGKRLVNSLLQRNHCLIKQAQCSIPQNKKSKKLQNYQVNYKRSFLLHSNTYLNYLGIQSCKVI